jgi:tripartite-type tricarboxylate transporter receptor subunit TctC
MATGVSLAHVPMNGAAPAVTAVLGGHVSMSFMGFQVIQSHIDAGTLRALAVMYNKRLKQHPDIPTSVEKGYPKLQSAVWVGYFVPAKTPPEIVKKLGEVFHAAGEDKEVTELCEKAGFAVENMNQQESIKYMADEVKKWGEVVKAANISPK